MHWIRLLLLLALVLTMGQAGLILALLMYIWVGWCKREHR